MMSNTGQRQPSTRNASVTKTLQSSDIRKRKKRDTHTFDYGKKIVGA